jgi:hypothetical protein
MLEHREMRQHHSRRLQTPRTLKLSHTLFALVALALEPANAGEAWIAADGDLKRLYISQSGYCGERKEIDSADWKGTAVRGDEQVWLFGISVFRNGKNRSVCQIERTFTPKSGSMYLMRVSYVPKDCKVQFFKAVAGADPLPERTRKPDPQECTQQ